MKKYGYIGKSFVLGSVGIVASLIAACGGGGITDVVANTAAPSENVLFAMAFQPTSSASDSTLKWKTAQGGGVYVGTGGTANNGAGNWTYGDWGTWEQTDIDTKGFVAVQFKHLTALDANDYMYYKVTGPQEAGVDVSATDSLIVTMGNEKIGGEANTPMEVTVFVNGGAYDSQTYSYANSCSVKQTLRNTTLPNTYVIPLANLTCSTGTLAELTADVQTVELKILPGDGNAATDASTTGNLTLLELGSIAFSKNRF